MALYGWQRPPTNAGYGLYGPQAPGTTGPKYHPPKQPKPKSTFHKPRPTRPTRPGQVYDPLAPTPDSVLRANAQQMSQAELAANIKIITDAINSQRQAGESAILGNTQALGNLFAQAAPQTAAAYQQATQAVGGANTELANRLNSVGTNLGNEIQGKLALQNAPSNVVGQVAGGTGSMIQGVSNANFAKGTAELSRLAAEGAHAGEYAAKLPGIAALTGMQHSRELEAQLNKQLADQIGQASSKAQDTFATLYQHYVDQEWQKTLARQSGQFKNAQAAADAKYKAQQIAYKKASLAWQKAKTKADRAEKAREANQRTQTQRGNAAMAEAGRNARASQSQANQNLRQNKWQVNPDGTFKTRINHKTGKRERIPIKPPKKNSGSSSGL